MATYTSIVYEEYMEYTGLCEMLHVEPLKLNEKFYEHEEELMSLYGYVKDGNEYIKIDTKRRF